MKALAGFVVRGRMQATIVASVLAVLAVLITPLSVISAAAIGLVALSQGIREGFLVTLMGLVALVALGWLLFDEPLVLLATGAVLWLPLLVLGEALRITRSLRLVVEIAAAAGMLLIALQYLLLDDVTRFWTELLQQYLTLLMNPEVVQEADRQSVVEALAPWMAGGLGAAWFIQLVLSVFLARSWQSVLYHPGGFSQEFYQLRLGRWRLLLVPVLMAIIMLGDKPGFLAQLALVGMGAFFIQGIALMHGLVNNYKAGQVWLIGFYLLLIIGMPASFTAVSAAGYADGWLNIRAKARPGSNKKGSG
jgi:hypothetical protein